MDPRNTSEMIYVDIRIELIWHPKWNNYYYFVVSKQSYCPNMSKSRIRIIRNWIRIRKVWSFGYGWTLRSEILEDSSIREAKSSNLHTSQDPRCMNLRRFKHPRWMNLQIFKHPRSSDLRTMKTETLFEFKNHVFRPYTRTSTYM
jgi:hypothetical protein